MRIVRNRTHVDFTVVANRVLRDTRLSYRALGLLVELLSRPDDWRTSSDELARDRKEGRDAIRSALREIEEAGYLTRRRVQGQGGLWSTVWELFDSPPEDRSTGDGFPGVGQPDVGQPDLGGPGPIRRTETKNRDERNLASSDDDADDDPQGSLLPDTRPSSQPQVSTFRRRPRDDVWDAVMDACGVDAAAIPRAARGAYNRAVKDLRDVGATPEQIRDRAAVFRLTWPGASLTPTALARRWSEVSRLQPRPATTDQRVAAGMAMREHFAAMDRRDAR